MVDVAELELQTMPAAAVHDSSLASRPPTTRRKSIAEIEAETDEDPEKHKKAFLSRTGITTETATFRLFAIFGSFADETIFRGSRPIFLGPEGFRKKNEYQHRLKESSRV